MPRQLKEILHAKGISLVGALAAAGILGGLAMVFAQLTKQQMQAQKRAETGVEIVALSQRVVRTLYDGKACINTLGAGRNIIPQASFDLDAIKNKDDQVVYQALTADPNAPSYGNRLLKVASLKLVVNTNPNPIPGDQAGAMLEVTLQKISSAYTGQIETVKKFPVTLELDTAKKLVGCVSDISAVADPVKEAICKEIGGTTAWNAGSKKCTFGACPSGQYLEGFDSSGKVCKNLPQIADMACAQQGWAVTKFQNGLPVCALVTGGNQGQSNNNPQCSSLADSAIRSALGSFSGTYGISGAAATDECGAKTTASKNLCSSTQTTYTEYTPLGGCYAGGNIVACSGAECATTNAGNSLEARYCEETQGKQCPSNCSGTTATITIRSQFDYLAFLRWLNCCQKNAAGESLGVRQFDVFGGFNDTYPSATQFLNPQAMANNSVAWTTEKRGNICLRYKLPNNPVPTNVLASCDRGDRDLGNNPILEECRPGREPWRYGSSPYYSRGVNP